LGFGYAIGLRISRVIFFRNQAHNLPFNLVQLGLERRLILRPAHGLTAEFSSEPESLAECRLIFSSALLRLTRL